MCGLCFCGLLEMLENLVRSEDRGRSYTIPFIEILERERERKHLKILLVYDVIIVHYIIGPIRSFASPPTLHGTALYSTFESEWKHV